MMTVDQPQLRADYPGLSGKPVHIKLRALEAPGLEEREFLRLAVEHHLMPDQIRSSWRVIGEQAFT
jgi:hypothetical protein